MIVLAFQALMLVSVLPGYGTDDYAAETGQPCSVCHISDLGGGGLTPAGERYVDVPESWQPPVKTGTKPTFILRLAHLALLYVHIIFGIIWVGTILYVHLVLKPKYALGGLPKSELRLAWVSMPVIAVSGTLLTIWRVRVTPGLFSSVFGKLLLGKITIFLLMLFSATFVTLFVGPRLRRMIHREGLSQDRVEEGRFTLEKLKASDGSDGGRALVAVKGKVWDLSTSPMWPAGLHAGRHRAGADMTEYLKNAPHGVDVLDRYPQVGEIVSAREPVPGVVRIFTVNAYFNLAGCFLIILILALWRW